MNNETSQPAGYILYDDDCGVCRRWVPFWEPTLRKRGFAIASLQTPWVQAQLKAAPDDLLADIRLLFANGDQLRGADVYRYAMRHIGWAYPLYLLASAPLLRNVFDWGYRIFADNRNHVSAACQLPPAPRDGGA